MNNNIIKELKEIYGDNIIVLERDEMLIDKLDITEEIKDTHKRDAINKIWQELLETISEGEQHDVLDRIYSQFDDIYTKYESFKNNIDNIINDLRDIRYEDDSIIEDIIKNSIDDYDYWIKQKMNERFMENYEYHKKFIEDIGYVTIVTTD